MCAWLGNWTGCAFLYICGCILRIQAKCGNKLAGGRIVTHAEHLSPSRVVPFIIFMFGQRMLSGRCARDKSSRVVPFFIFYVWSTYSANGIGDMLMILCSTDFIALVYWWHGHDVVSASRDIDFVACVFFLFWFWSLIACLRYRCSLYFMLSLLISCKFSLLRPRLPLLFLLWVYTG